MAKVSSVAEGGGEWEYSRNITELTARSTVFNHSSPGMSILNTMYRSPFESGCLYTGMPSPLATTDSPGLTVFPGGLLMWIPLPSRWVTRIREKPKRASERVMCTDVKRSFPERWNESCGVCLRTKTTSPGGIPGSSSPAPARTILCWFAMPLSTSNSCRVFSLTVLAPLHFLHLHFHQLVTDENIISFTTLSPVFFTEFFALTITLGAHGSRSAYLVPPNL